MRRNHQRLAPSAAQMAMKLAIAKVPPLDSTKVAPQVDIAAGLRNRSTARKTAAAVITKNASRSGHWNLAGADRRSSHPSREDNANPNRRSRMSKPASSP